MIFRVWKDASKDNWQDATTIEEANAIDFGFGYDQVQVSSWSKEAHLAEINALHEAEFERRWMAAGYKTEEELSRAIGNPKNKFHAEAMLIDDYWWDGWDAIVAYADTLTEQPTETPEEFFNQLNSTL